MSIQCLHHITLVCGSWNVALARRLGVADEVRGYDFFPENGASWNGQAFEGLQRFREICRGDYDLALDLRVDEDTRFLLKHVEAAARCGIGPRARYPFLDIALPPQFDLAAGHQLQTGQAVPLSSFPEGDYRLEIKVTDKIANKSVTRDVNFTVAGS